MKTKPIPQYEFRWDQPEPFRLVAEAVTEGEQVAREQRQKEFERKQQENNQIHFDERPN